MHILFSNKYLFENNINITFYILYYNFMWSTEGRSIIILVLGLGAKDM